MIRKEINILSEPVEELLSKIPYWITRWGISLIFIILLFVIVISTFITYPEIIKGKLIIINNYSDTISCFFLIQPEEVYKIKPGNEILLKLERYPFQKFGMVKGKIVNISDSTINGYLLGTILLPPKINTLQSTSIIIRNTSKADCEIIVDKRSIFKKLLNCIINN
jgi:hypothetical protein